VSVGIGAKLRRFRQQWQLSLREVEERSLSFAQEQGNQSYEVAASWLDRLEREEDELTVNKPIALAGMCSMSTEQLLLDVHGRPSTRLQATFQFDRDDVLRGRPAGRAGLGMLALSAGARQVPLANSSGVVHGGILYVSGRTLLDESTTRNVPGLD
jgi:hypothetical protein